MKLEIKCYKVLSFTGETIQLQQTDDNKILDSIKCIEELGHLYILFSYTHRERIFGKYNNKYPVSEFLTEGIPMANTSQGKDDTKACMLSEIEHLTSMDDIQEHDYIFTADH